MSTLLLRSAGAVGYRTGLAPRPSATPDARLVELVEGPSALPRGRALDLGCATGRNLLYLGSHGWDATGVEMVAYALSVARRTAEAGSVPVRLVLGDVTRLEELGIGDGYTLLMDGGCLHMVPPSRRDAYARGVTRLAAPGAILIVVGFGHRRFAGGGVSAEELRERLPEWDLFDAAPVPGPEMQGYVSGPAPMKLVLRRGWLRAWRYQLRRA